MEWLGRAVVVVLAAGAPLAVLVARARGARDVIVLRADMPEAGGWQPAALTAAVGEPLRLRLTSGDVVHGFAIGRDTLTPVEVKPGQVTELTLRFDRPGTYTFYCTRWCGPNHWRMRGTIQVRGPGAAEPASPAPYIALGVDLDAPHPASALPARRPSAAHVTWPVPGVPDSLLAAGYLRRHSPEAVWRVLRAEAGLRTWSDQRLWDVVAWLWRQNTSAEAAATGRRLYARNCAACHGEVGRGDGVMAGALLAALASPGPATAHASTIGRPTDFTHADLLAASPVLLHGKIVRGGMGTGMPSWGAILTDAEAWALVDYLYHRFVFDDIRLEEDDERHTAP